MNFVDHRMKNVIDRVLPLVTMYIKITDGQFCIAADDNPMKLMSIAMKPIALPPFPLEKIEEMT